MEEDIEGFNEKTLDRFENPSESYSNERLK